MASTLSNCVLFFHIHWGHKVIFLQQKQCFLGSRTYKIPLIFGFKENPSFCVGFLSNILYEGLLIMPIRTSLRIHLKVHLSFDSIDERLALRDSLQCKPFSWYLSNVYPDLRVPEAEDISFGSIRQNNLCLDTLGHLSDGLVGLYGCHGAGGNQDWSLTKNGHIKHGSDLCVALESPKTGTKLRLRLCNNSPLQVSYTLAVL